MVKKRVSVSKRRNPQKRSPRGKRSDDIMRIPERGKQFKPVIFKEKKK